MAASQRGFSLPHCNQKSEKRETERDMIQHFSHPHTLTLHEVKATSFICCNACELLISGIAYSCDNCNFFLHKSCADRLPPEIRHPLHSQHKLTLLPKSPYPGGRCTCHACDNFFTGFTFHCSLCRLDLDVLCATHIHKNESQAETKRRIRHFSHPHPLTLCEKFELTRKKYCSGCNLRIWGEIYGCENCNFFLHKSCAELPTEMQHHLHQAHPLTLLSLLPNPPSTRKRFTCNACGDFFSGFSFHCHRCQFNLDLLCASPDDTTDNGVRINKETSLQHFSHHHSLTLFRRTKPEERSYCSGCKIRIWGTVYGCESCEFFLHKSCAQLPREMQHPLHPDHALALLAKPPYPSNQITCDACNDFCSGFTFHCAECKFDLDVICATSRHTRQSGGHRERHIKVKHLSHCHPLTLCEMREPRERNDCSGCELRLWGIAYGCEGCNFLLHKSCAELEDTAVHPLHPEHPLRLNYPGSIFKCGACRDYHSGLAYSCRECNFNLNVHCASPTQTLKHRSHQHLLFCLRGRYNAGDDPHYRCHACAMSCDRPTFSCLQCNFNLHVDCALLPESIKCDHHIHSLELTFSVDEDDSDQSYCDVCEKIRNPKCWVYYCEECRFVADLGCLKLVDHPHGHQ